VSRAGQLQTGARHDPQSGFFSSAKLRTGTWPPVSISSGSSVRQIDPDRGGTRNGKRGRPRHDYIPLQECEKRFINGQAWRYTTWTFYSFQNGWSPGFVRPAGRDTPVTTTDAIKPRKLQDFSNVWSPSKARIATGRPCRDGSCPNSR